MLTAGIIGCSSLTVGIIGCGSIGALKPESVDNPKSKYALTHANAVSRHPEFELKWVMDADWNKAIKAAERWGVARAINSYSKYADLDYYVDIVVIATPEQTHLQVIRDVMQHFTPKIIIIEKPCGASSDECAEIMELTKNVPHVLVNYSRRYNPKLREFRELLQSVDVYHAQFTYGHGLYRDGCHAIDLARWFFGDRVTHCRPSMITIKDDVDADFTLHHWVDREFFNSVSTHFITVPYQQYAVFDFDALTSIGKLSLRNYGQVIVHELVVPETTYSDAKYSRLDAMQRGYQRTDLEMNLMHLYDTIASGSYEYCTLADALAVHKIMEGVING